MFTAQDSMDVFAGVAEHMPSESSVDDISELQFLCTLLFLYMFRSSSCNRQPNAIASIDISTFPVPRSCFGTD